MRRWIIILAGILPLLNAGCVSSENHPPPESWPKPVAAKNVEQFEGVFLNHSFDSETGKAAENGNELFVFLLGPTHASADAGGRVEIRASDGGQQLQLQLLDKQGHQIDSGTLRRGIDFDFADGQLVVRGPSSGWRSLNSNFGPGLTLESDELYVTSRGDLLASTSENSAALAMMFIPSASTTKYWMFWPKLPK
jgi:hypothetical protein